MAAFRVCQNRSYVNQDPIKTGEKLHTNPCDEEALARTAGEGGRSIGGLVDCTARVPRLDEYVFAGYGLTDVVARCTQLTGRMEFPPWGALGYQRVQEVGIAGIWNDMNEPSCFSG